MQQREQLILKKLAEAREAQASAMTRFIQARARVMLIEARLQILRSRLNPSPTSPTLAAETEQQKNEEEESTKGPALQPVPAEQSSPRDLSEEETLILALAEIIEASLPDQPAPDQQQSPIEQPSGEEVTPVEDTSATDITTKMPAIGRKRPKSQETT